MLPCRKLPPPPPEFACDGCIGLASTRGDMKPGVEATEADTEACYMRLYEACLNTINVILSNLPYCCWL